MAVEIIQLITVHLKALHAAQLTRIAIALRQVLAIVRRALVHQVLAILRQALSIVLKEPLDIVH